ncbi:hypothetical protein PG996_012069 [Apiospora saccharicola]|uniref:Uncharacterized protein n=1 Tax=Apiospora saccharicola TaxID=335842 RepID=A0ABR1U1I8_9PEZI
MASTVSRTNTTASSVSSLTATTVQASRNSGNLVIWIDTKKAVADFLDKIIDLPDSPPSLPTEDNLPFRHLYYEVFNQRTLAQELKDYCVADVTFLPRLWALYTFKIAAAWRPKFRSATEAQIRDSQSATYSPHSHKKARGPPTWEYY